VRQRYDFTADQTKLEYTRILNSRTVLEVGAGKFYSTELGPPEDDKALAGIQRSTYPALASLPQFAAVHNPLNLIPKVTFGTLQSAQGSDQSPNISYDNRWPITGADTAVAFSANLTHTRGAHTFKTGVLREHERFHAGALRCVCGRVQRPERHEQPEQRRVRVRQPVSRPDYDLHRSDGARPGQPLADHLGVLRAGHLEAASQGDAGRGTPHVQLEPPLSPTGEASGFSFERFDPNWGGKPPVLFRPVLVNGVRRALNPLTGVDFPAPFIGQMVPGSGYTCGVIIPENPCPINGIVTQRDGKYIKGGGEGFVDPLPLQYDPRVGIAFAPNPKTVIRLAGGAFHDGTGGAFFQGGPAFRFDRVIRYTDFGSYMTGTGTTTPVSVSGTERTNSKQPVSYKYTLALQREIGWNVVMDVAYVGDTTQDLRQDFNFNAIPAGARYLPQNRDLTVADSNTVGLQPNKPNPGALPDVFLRPIPGFGDINISAPIGKSWYDSVQTQLTRRFIGVSSSPVVIPGQSA
jgi:hypothetical protein